MAIHADTVWEMRTTGDASNGGGFYNRNDGTSVDYSQQDSAQLSLTDLAMVDTETTLTSATGGFTAAMVGNIIYIASGTNFTAGWYEITAYTDTNTVTLDRTAVSDGNGSDGVGKVGGATLAMTDAFFEQFTAGNKCWVKTGTYTLTETIDVAKAGTVSARLVIEGYKTTRGDVPKGDDRPLITGGSYGFYFGNYWHVKNFRNTSTANTAINIGPNSVGFNLKTEKSSGSGWVYGFTGEHSQYICCQSKSTGLAFSVSRQSHIINCYAHDSNVGLRCSISAQATYINNVVVNCTTGLIPYQSERTILMHNTIYGCATGINGGGIETVLCANNIIVGSTTVGITTNSDRGGSWLLDCNCFYNNTLDVEYVTKGPNAVNADPKLNDPDNGDFTLQSGSPCLNTGVDAGTYNSGITV